MGGRKPAPDPIEAALETLETADGPSAAGVAAERRALWALRRIWIAEVLIAIATILPIGVVLATRDAVAIGWGIAITVAAIAFAFAMDRLLDVSANRRRLRAAVARWRRIAGTWAIGGKAP